MRDALLIAKREYLEQIRSKTFKVTTILIPVLFIFIFGSAFLAMKKSGVGRRVAIASNDVELASNLQRDLLSDKAAQMQVEVIAPATSSDHEALLKQVETKQLDGFLWLEAKPGEAPTSVYESRSSGDFTTQERLLSALNEAVMQQQLSTRGVSQAEIESLTKKINIKTLQFSNGKAAHSDAVSSLITAYVMAFLLTFTCVTYGMNVGRSVIEEKTSRVFEVMLASVEAKDLLAGKLIGVGFVGLTQLGIWLVAGALISSSAIAARFMTGDMTLHVSAFEIVLFCVYFVLGYLLYSSLFAGLGSTVESAQEFQQYTPLAAVPVWLSFSLMTYIVGNPNSIWAIAVSMFPPCAPITMFLRMSSQFPPLWQIGLSILFMVLAIMLVLWFSSRLYRVGILMYGKKADIPEILRWLRYS
jgi:ABC-2 type transport system permease protein